MAQPSVPATKQSSTSLGPTAAQLLERDVAVLSTHVDGNSDEKFAILLAMLHSLLAETLSSDKMFLAMGNAKAICSSLGIDERVFQEVLEKVLAHRENVVSRNPLSKLF